MPAKNKIRGNALEREVVKMARERGFNAERAWGSDGKSLGEHSEVDVRIRNFNTYKIQCKRVKRLAKYLTPSEHVDFQVVREDRGKAMAVIPLDNLLKMLNIIEECIADRR